MRIPQMEIKVATILTPSIGKFSAHILDLLQDKVELCFCLVHLVSFKKTEVSSPEEMVRVVHDDLVSCCVEKCRLRKIECVHVQKQER